MQVAKDPLGTKGARVTPYVTIPGRYVVLMPNMEHVGISGVFEDEELRTTLKNIAYEIKRRDAA